ncbi:MAG: phosphate ABC transporter permease PstA [Myxococcota bacterium]
MTLERLGPWTLAVSAALCVAVFIGLLLIVIAEGASVLSVDFLLSSPRDGMLAGGIAPAIVGTIAITLAAAVLSVPIGVGAAVYLYEYAPAGPVTRTVRFAVRNLAGVPSIVYGLFGLALFVDAFQLGSSIAASGMTLGLLTLPWTITASDEALRAVPTAHRENALALGAGPWHAIRTVVLPSALPGILTGAILAVARAAGETAPILFTGVVYYMPGYPSGLGDSFMALPYHLYVLATQHNEPLRARPLAYATSLVLMGLVLVLSVGAMVARAKLARRN